MVAKRNDHSLEEIKKIRIRLLVILYLIVACILYLNYDFIKILFSNIFN